MEAIKHFIFLTLIVLCAVSIHAKTYRFQLESEKAWGFGNSTNKSTSADILTYDSGHLTLFSENEKLNETGVKVTIENRVDDKFFFNKDKGNQISKLLVFWKGNKPIVYVGYSENGGKIINECIAMLQEWNGRKEWYHYYYHVNKRPSELDKNGIGYKFYQTYKEMCEDVRKGTVNKSGTSANYTPDAKKPRPIYNIKPIDLVEKAMMVVPIEKATWDYCRNLALNTNNWNISTPNQKKELMIVFPDNVILDIPGYGKVFAFDLFFNANGKLKGFSSLKNFEWEGLDNASLEMYMMKENLVAKGVPLVQASSIKPVNEGETFVSGYKAPYKGGEVYLYISKNSRGYMLVLYRKI